MHQWVAHPDFLRDIAGMHMAYPQIAFISPSIQNYQILPHMPGSGPTYEHWQARCETLLKVCDFVLVFMYKHWRESNGVADEIRMAVELGKPVIYLNVATGAYGKTPDEVNA